MNLLPAIDLQSGKCVRLYQGCYDKTTVYEDDPIKQAQSFVIQGADTLHIVDLDGAKLGEAVNLAVILEIKKVSLATIQTGGGIRSKQQALQLLNQGIDRIVIGSLAISKPHEIKQWLREFGSDRIVLALDIRNGKLAVHGWQTNTEKTLWNVLDEYQDSSLQHILCTDISKDGTLQGPNIELYKSCVERYPSMKFQASGGIGCLHDLSLLSKIPVNSCIIGKALYENKFSLRDALQEVQPC